ncbi:MAG: cbb3-type cytochrome c oxidase subunit I [Aquificaceae bacterium]|nr:cbb3-type cytochrome c oxidase subunit I [Aquificaceae bacterium]
MLFYLSLSLFSLVLAGLFGLLIALTRTPVVSLLKSPELFYHFLVGHVTFSITVWLMTFTLAFWHYRKDKMVTSAQPTTLLGMILLSISCLIPYGEPHLNNYIPVIGHPVFYLGLALFFFGFSIEVLQRLGSLRLILSPDTRHQLYALSISTGLLTLVSFLPSFLVAHPEGGTRMYFERLFWIPGHLQQFMYTSVMLAVWHELFRRASNREVNSPLLGAVNPFLFLFPLSLFLGFFTDPISQGFRLVVVLAFGVGMGVPVLLHTFFLLKDLRLGWNVATLSLLTSMSVYYAGEVIAYAGMQSDLRIPAHYHGVVSGVTISFMGLTYYMLKERYGSVFWERAARLQPLVFGVGINLLVLGFYLAGRLGTPRKTYGFEYVQDLKVILALNIMGIGSLMAVLGGLLFLAYATPTLLKNYRHVKTF